MIVPIYKVRDYIAHCATALMEQTLNDVEYIFVDDATPDDSVEVLNSVVKKYPDRCHHIKLLTHNINRGLPAARNTGLDAAQGEYIFHWDSDDFAETDLLERLYRKAKNDDCDYVWCDWFLTFGKNSRVMSQPAASSPREALSIALSGGMKYNVWNKLVARRLYTESGIRFPEGLSMGEDMTMIKLLAGASRVGHVNKPLYHYVRTNSGAMTQIYSPKHLSELQVNTEDLCSFLKAEIHDGDIAREINWFKLNVKLPFLFTGRKEDIRLWRAWYPETNKDIMSNRRQALRTRVLQWTAAHRLNVVNTFYNALVLNFIYGVIYK